MKIKTNPLMVWTMLLLAAYWSAAALLPGSWVNSFTSAALLVAGGIVVTTSLPESYQIIKRGTIGPGQLAVIGISVLAIGSIYSGAFGVLWAWAGYPKGWVGTAVSAFGKMLHVIGFALVYLSPDATAQGIKRPPLLVLGLGVLVIAAMSFILGTLFPQM